MISYSCCSEICAGIVLNCLFCRFYDLFLMLPETCERAAISICPAYMLFSPPVESAHNNNWNCSCDFDCGLMDACHETGECLELAMEISEVCYRWVACKTEDVALLEENFTIPHHFGIKSWYFLSQNTQSMPSQANVCSFGPSIIKISHSRLENKCKHDKLLLVISAQLVTILTLISNIG